MQTTMFERGPTTIVVVLVYGPCNLSRKPRQVLSVASGEPRGSNRSRVH